MAGLLALVASEQTENAVTTIRDQWQIQFSRFFTCPSLSSSCPSLIALPRNRRSRPTRGNWISASSSAFLKILNDNSSFGEILAVSFNGEILEEHYISKLHFSWPQVLCMSGFPARGSRALIVSYKDSEGEIQKFALRFTTGYETETFINTLKEILKDNDIEPLNSSLVSEISPQSEIVSSHRLPSRECEEEMSTMTPAHTYTPQMPQSLNCKFGQHSYSQETMLNHNSAGINPALPPSFTSFLTSCYSEAKEVQPQTVSGEVDLRSQIAKYMEDSSFQDILIKVEKVISQMGDDFLL